MYLKGGSVVAMMVKLGFLVNKEVGFYALKIRKNNNTSLILINKLYKTIIFKNNLRILF